MSEQTEVKEETKLKGIAAYHEKKRLEKEQAKGIVAERNVMVAEQKEKRAAASAELDFGIDINKTYVFETLVKSDVPRHELLSASCKIFDASQGRMRVIKYIPIADTIFVDEMGERYDGYPDAHLSFHRNSLVVNGSDIRLIEYLLSHDRYDGNTNRISKGDAMYTLVNKHDLEKKKEARHALELKAYNLINDNDINELLPISRVVFNIMDSDETIVRNHLREWAKKDPVRVLDNFESPKVKRSYVIQSALDNGVVEVNHQSKSLVWGGTKAFIKELVATKDMEAQLNELTDFSFTPEGTKVYEIIKNKLSTL